jgi:hypothetical protein
MSGESEETPSFQFEQDLVRFGNELKVGARRESFNSDP